MPVTDKITMPDGSSVFIWNITETEKELSAAYIKHTDKDNLPSAVTDIKVARKRKQWLAARILSYESIKGFQGLYYDQFGAPHLVEDDRCISYSHSYDKVALIIHDEYEVGIDIQKEDEKLKRISSKFLNEDETKRYGESHEDLDYLHFLWSIKECIFKVHKHHLPFKDIKTHKMLKGEQGEVNVTAERFDGPHEHVVHYHKLKGYYLAHSCYLEV